MTSDRRHAYVDTSLGDLLVVAQGQSLAGLYFTEHRYPPAEADLGRRVDPAADPFIAGVAAQLGEYLAGDRREFTVATETSGDAFSERVWALLREIPYGATTSYGALAETLGNKLLAQRVGQAVGHNPISIIVPCHRVVGADGSLTGFAGGLARKRALLDLEEPESARAQRLF